MQTQQGNEDKKLLANIHAALKKHGELDSAQYSVSVKKGEVMLRGLLDNKDQRRRILTTVRGVHGVKNIREELKVAERPGRDRGSEHELSSLPA